MKTRFSLLIILLISFSQRTNAQIPCNYSFFDQFTMTFGSAFSHSTPPTLPGGNYVFEVDGTWGVANSTIHRDAAYNLTPNIHIPGNCDACWFLNGAFGYRPDPDIYSPAHHYTYSYTGDGNPINFSFVDTQYPDNSGQLDFIVYYVPDSTGVTGPIQPGDTTVLPGIPTTFQVTPDTTLNLSILWSTGDTTSSINFTTYTDTVLSVFITDGSTSYCDTIQIVAAQPLSPSFQPDAYNKAKVNMELRIFPNPANDYFLVSLPTPENSDLFPCTISIWNLFGQQIQRETYLTRGLEPVKVETRELEPSTYLIWVQDEHGNSWRSSLIIKDF